MEYGIEKCVMLEMKGGKRHQEDRIKLPNQDKIRKLGEKATYKYLGILEADTMKQGETKEKIKKEYLKITRKLLETKLCSKNLIKGINIWAVSLIRYSGPFLKWTKKEHQQMDLTTSELMTMHEALHPRDDVDKKGGLASIEDRVDASIKRLEDYTVIIVIRNDMDNTKTKRMTITKKTKKWEVKQLDGRLKRLISNISHEKTCTWLRKGNVQNLS